MVSVRCSGGLIYRICIVAAPREEADGLTWAEFLFTFVDSTSGEPVTLSRFRIAFFDFDQAPEGQSRECMTTKNFSSVLLPPQEGSARRSAEVIAWAERGSMLATSTKLSLKVRESDAGWGDERSRRSG